MGTFLPAETGDFFSADNTKGPLSQARAVLNEILALIKEAKVLEDKLVGLVKVERKLLKKERDVVYGDYFPTWSMRSRTQATSFSSSFSFSCNRNPKSASVLRRVLMISISFSLVIAHLNRPDPCSLSIGPEECVETSQKHKRQQITAGFGRSKLHGGKAGMGSSFHMMTPPIPGDTLKNALRLHPRCCIDPKEINEGARSALP